MSDQTDTARRATVRVLQAEDPEATGRSVAAEQDGEVAVDLPAAEQAVRARVEAGRRALGDPAADEGIVARAATIRAAAEVPPPIAADQVAELERLARELDRAARIRERTEARFAETIQTRIAASSGVALHPEAIREAAGAVVEAAAAVQAADAALATLGDQPPLPAPPPPPEPLPLSGDDPVLQRPHDVFDELALDKRRASGRAATIGGGIAAVGLLALLLGQTAIGGLVLVAGIAAGVVLAVRGHQAAEAEDATRVQASNRVEPFVADAPSAPAPPAPPATAADPVADPVAVAHWEEQRSTRTADRMDAAERLRLAETRWHQLAGPDADAHHPESVIRAHDPQLSSDPRIAEGSPTVRTVAAFHRTVQAKWRVLWASLGVDDPPGPEQLDATLADVLGASHHAIAELGELDAAEARIEARAAAARPLVLVEPSRWIDETELSQLVASVPPEGTVLVVERAS